MQKCQLFFVQKIWREIQSGLEAIEVFLEVTIYVLHTVHLEDMKKHQYYFKFCSYLFVLVAISVFYYIGCPCAFEMNIVLFLRLFLFY